MGCGVTDWFQDEVIDPVKDVFQEIDDHILEPIYDPIKEAIDPLLPEWVKEIDDTVKDRLLDPQHLLRHPAELWKVPRDIAIDVLDPVLPEKVKEFFHKPGRTLAASWISEDPKVQKAIEGVMGAIGIILAPATGGASIWISQLASAGYGSLARADKLPEGTSFGDSLLPVGFGALEGYGMAQLGAGITGGVTSMSNGTGFVDGFKTAYKDYAINIAPDKGLSTEVTPEITKALGEATTQLAPVEEAMLAGDMSWIDSLKIGGTNIADIADASGQLQPSLGSYLDDVMAGTIRATGESVTGGMGKLGELYNTVSNVGKTMSKVSGTYSQITGEEQPDFMNYVNMVNSVGPTLQAAKDTGKNIYNFFTPDQAKLYGGEALTNYLNEGGKEMAVINMTSLTPAQLDQMYQQAGGFPLGTILPPIYPGGGDISYPGAYDNLLKPPSVLNDLTSTPVPGTQDSALNPNTGKPWDPMYVIDGKPWTLSGGFGTQDDPWNVTSVSKTLDDLAPWVGGAGDSGWDFNDILGNIGNIADTAGKVYNVYDDIFGGTQAPTQTQTQYPAYPAGGVYSPSSVYAPGGPAYGGPTYGAYNPNINISNQNIQNPVDYENVIASLFPSNQATPTGGDGANMMSNLLSIITGGGDPGGGGEYTDEIKNLISGFMPFPGGGSTPEGVPGAITSLINLIPGLNNQGGLGGFIQSITGNKDVQNILGTAGDIWGAYETGKQAEEQREWWEKQYAPQQRIAGAQADLMENVYKPYQEGQYDVYKAYTQPRVASDYGLYKDVFEPATRELGGMLSGDLGKEFSLTKELESDIWRKGKERLATAKTEAEKTGSERFAGAGMLGQGPAFNYFQNIDQQYMKGIEDLAVEQSIWEYGQKYREKQDRYTNMASFLNRSPGAYAPSIGAPSSPNYDLQNPTQQIDWNKIAGDIFDDGGLFG